MKLLQTGDLHLGKTLHETSLIEDQRFMLDSLRTVLESDDYQALVIAGDIYDRTVPSAEAVALFSDFLVKLRAGCPTLDIFIIPGNHDSAQRLAFASPLLGAQRIYIICNPSESFTPIVTGTGNDRAAFFLLPFLAPGSLKLTEETKADADMAKKEEGERAAAKAGERAMKSGAGRKESARELEFDFFTPEPALAASDSGSNTANSSANAQASAQAPAQAGNLQPVKQGADSAEPPALPADSPAPGGTILASQAELASEAARRFRAALSDKTVQGMPAVLVAHCFALGGAASDSERVFLGTAERVDPALFSGFTYTALGHLHKRQKVADRIHYAGAPLVYAFDEAGTEKTFLKVEINASAPDFPVTVTPIPITPLRPVSRKSGSFDSFYSAPSREPWADHYLEITLTDGEIVANPMNLLKSRYPWLLSIRQAALEINALPGSADLAPSKGIVDSGTGETGSGQSGNSRAPRNAMDDFRSFEEALYGTVETEREKLFAELLKECRSEA